MDNHQLNLILDINQQAKEKGKNFPKKRYLFEKLLSEKDKKTATGVTGLRGSGKTVLFCQLLNTLPSSFYLSCDAVEKINLYQLADFLVRNYQIRYLLLDEIHYQKNWAKEMKLIIDFLKIKLYFTSSVSLNVLSSKSDLSRRVKIFSLPIFSFREYLDFKLNQNFPPLTFEEIIKNHQKLFLKYYSTEKYFEEYLSFCLPFSLDDPSFVLVKQIIDKIIKKDLFYYENLNQEDIQGLENTANFIANSPIGEINYSILSKNIGITKYKAKQYVDYLEKSFILKSIFPYSSNVIKEPKIILTLPFRKALNFRLANDQLKGALKEEFFVQALKNNNKLYYLKSNRGKKTPDYLLLYQGKKYIFEIGGPKKGYSQFKGVSNDYEKYLITYPGINQKNKIPLILFGFLD